MSKQLNINGLGSIVMYSLSTGIHIPIQDFWGKAHILGVDSSLFPNALSDNGAFQRATSMAASTFVLAQEPVLCKEVMNNKEKIVRTFEKRIVDDDGTVKSIEEGNENIPVYSHVATMVYDKQTGTITPTILHNEGRPVVEKALENFRTIRSQYNIQQVRQTIQNAFNRYGSIQLRHNGGVNFIPAQYEDEWKKFSNFIESFEGVEIMSINVKNDTHNRAVIRNSLMSNVNESLEDEIKRLGGKSEGSKELTKLVEDFGKALEGGKVKKGGLKTIVNRFNHTMEVVNVYKELLSTDLSIITAQVDVAKKQVVALLERGEDCA